jgi:hypothetical protein
MLADEAVTEQAIGDLAVSIAKEESPLQIASVQAVAWVNQALDTTLQEVITATVDIPTWAGVCHVIAVGRVQWSNGSGGNQNLFATLDVVGLDNAVATSEHTVANNTTGALPLDATYTVTAPGSTVEVRIRAKVTTGTNSSNNSRLNLLALVER